MITIERRAGETWVRALTDRDWTTRFYWSTDPVPPPAPPVTEADVMGKARKNESEAAPESSGENGEAEETDELGRTASRATVTWDIPESMEPGVYRVIFHGAYLDGRDGRVKPFNAASSRFTVR